MEAGKENDEKPVKVPSLAHSFAIIVILLISITIFNASLRSLLGTGPTTRNDKKPPNYIYDPDLLQNKTKLCLRNDRNKRLDTTNCKNQTMYYWYIPWIREWVWNRYDEGTAERRRLKEIEEIAVQEEKLPENVPENITILEDEQNQTKTPEKDTKAEASSTAYTILTAMTLLLAIIALFELFREKFGKKPAEEAKELDRRCSLADFTIKRHERKESAQENLQRQGGGDDRKKVMLQLLHQGSLDRAISNLTPSVKRSKLPRQRSMPCRHPSLSSLLDRPNLQTLRNVSIDLPEEEPGGGTSPSMRRKSRHFIRRH